MQRLTDLTRSSKIVSNGVKWNARYYGRVGKVVIGYFQYRQHRVRAHNAARGIAHHHAISRGIIELHAVDGIAGIGRAEDVRAGFAPLIREGRGAAGGDVKSDIASSADADALRLARDVQ